MAGATKFNLKNLKTWLWLDDLMQATIWRQQLYSDGRFEPLINSGKSLTWAYKLKALKSVWWILFNTCDEQQFYINEMMMLILPAIAMFSCLHPVCLVSQTLKSTYIKEHLSVGVSKYRNLHYAQCLNIAQWKRHSLWP